MTRKTILFMLLIVGIVGCHNQKEMEPFDLSELSIGDIHRAYAEGKFTAEQLTRAYLSRIAEFDERINSITTINSEAISIAKQLDAEYQKTGKLRPLHGIPIVVKDNINTKGMPTTAGAFALKNFLPDNHAPIITRLVDAGAIILAKSNMAEWAFSPMHTESSTYGTTYNPYNLDYVPAGSSGGTASSIASNFGVVGLGTDTGNSIRGPASHCSLVGFRTTLGLISRSGIVPLFLRNDVVGPLSRTVEDATRVMEVMVGYDSEDPLTKHSQGRALSDYQQFLDKKGLSGTRIGVLRELSDYNIDPEVKALFEQAILDLRSLGAEIIDPLDIPDFSSLRQNQWCATFREDVESFLETYVKSDTIKTLEDIIRVGSDSRFSQDRLTDYVSQTGRWGDAEVACGDAYNDPKRIAFREAIENVMDSLNIDAIVYPSWNNKPARIGFFAEEYKGDNSQIISPHTGQPAFTVPMGFTSGNLPAGIQFLGRMYDEPTLIRLAYSYEQGTNHRKPPSQELDQPTEYFLTDFVYSEKYLNISKETENARATFWKPDGSLVFITGRYTDNVAAYKVNEPWQIHTAEFLHDEKLPGEFQHGLYFREDGKLMWVFDRTSIWSFTLETAWDITSRSEGTNQDLSHFAQRGHDIDFKPDGTLLFIDDRNAGAVYEYSLSIPWDVASGTLTYTLDISDQQIEVRGIEFLKEGSVMVLMDTGRDEILQYKLVEPWNISTAVFFDAFDVSTQTNQGRGLSFSIDETIMYVTGRDEEKIFQYELKQQ